MLDTHMLNNDGKEAVTKFKTKFANFIRDSLELMEDGRERSIFITKCEEASFFGTKAIASLEENHESKAEY